MVRAIMLLLRRTKGAPVVVVVVVVSFCSDATDEEEESDGIQETSVRFDVLKNKSSCLLEDNDGNAAALSTSSSLASSTGGMCCAIIGGSCSCSDLAIPSSACWSDNASLSSLSFIVVRIVLEDASENLTLVVVGNRTAER